MEQRGTSQQGLKGGQEDSGNTHHAEDKTGNPTEKNHRLKQD